MGHKLEFPYLAMTSIKTRGTRRGNPQDKRKQVTPLKNANFFNG